MRIPASYFDGKTSRRHAVELMHNGGMLLLDGEMHGTFLFRDVQVLERAGNKTRKIAFPDGAYIEVGDVRAFDALMAEAGYREPIAIRMHHSWRWVLIGLAILIAMTVPGYLYGLPAAAKIIAKRLPESMQHSIGNETLRFLDKRMFEPSELPIERQQAIVERFRSLKPPQAGAPGYEILFRKSKIGPNAFALPSGQIVMTDELVKLLADDDAVMGVLAHELGHLHERHMLRRMIQGSAVGLVSVALFGDVSSVVTTIPTVMLDMKYSRDAERESDDYAIAMMKANHINLQGLVLTFEKLRKKSPEIGAYLSSHPDTSERIARVRFAEDHAPPTDDAPASDRITPSSVIALQGEWRPDMDEWIKAARQAGATAEKEAELRESLAQTRIVFREGSRVYFDASRRIPGEFSYTAKPVAHGCYELEIAELGHRLACVSGDVLLMVDTKTSVTEHYIRH